MWNLSGAKANHPLTRIKRILRNLADSYVKGLSLNCKKLSSKFREE
jgi:hypothetical protein